MEGDEVAEKVNRVQGFAKVMANAYLVLDRRCHFLAPLLRDEDVKTAIGKKLEGTKGIPAWNQLVPWLGVDIIRDSVRVFLDEDKRTASFKNVFRKASVEPVFGGLREHFRTIPDRWNSDGEVIEGLTREQTEVMRAEWKAKSRVKWEKKFDDGWAKVQGAVKELEADEVGVKLLAMRNKYIAHLEVTPLGAEPSAFDVNSLGIVFNDILAFPERHRDALFELVRLTTGIVYAKNDYQRQHREQSDAMWKAVAK